MTEQTYYSNSANWGSYQYTSLSELVNNFMLINTGNDTLVGKVNRSKVLFYAKQAVQTYNYDAAREIRVFEYIVQDDLKMILPHDYINYVRISLEVDGRLFTMHENLQAISATAYDQDNNGDLQFDINGNVLTTTSQLDTSRLDQSIYYGPGIYDGCSGWCVDGVWTFGYSRGGYYGLDTDRARSTPSFRVNKKAGVIDFDSNISGQRVVLEYISDGLYAGDSETYVHKIAEKWIYAYIKWCILDDRIGVQEYIVRRAKNEQSSLLRNLKIALSNISAGRLLMVMRGKDKTIK